ncbi:MAG: hypothetical protein WD830_09885 [Chloroflexota bacterium]
MEKTNEVAGGVQTAAGANGGAAAAAGGGPATTADPGTGTGTWGEPEAPETPSTAPSGSIHYPREGDLPKETFTKNADGTWEYRDDETGETWTWDGFESVWRSKDGKENVDAGPPPQENDATSAPPA